MIVKTIQEIADMLNCDLVGEDKTSLIQGVGIDSRQVTENALYIPLIGQRADGHTFIDSVIQKGVKATLWQKDHTPYPEDITCILVDDTLEALQNLAKAYLNTLSCLVIGVTGSNGKTSCKDMLYSIFSQEKKTQKTQGNRNNEIGLPLTVLDLDKDVEVAILEMGMENKGEIDFLTHIARPDVSIITTIGSAHMENLGGKKQIAQAKLEILENLKPGGLFLYDKESPEIQECLLEMDIDPSKRLVSFGFNGDISIISSIDYTENGIEFYCSSLTDKITLNALGDFQAKNALPCIYVALDQGISTSSILKGLKDLEMTKMRTALLKVHDAKIIDDTYKSNPESAKAAIDTLMKVQAKKHIAVLADMLDLGPEENDLHAMIGCYAVEKNVDIVYATGPLSKYTIKACTNIESKWFETKDEIVEELKHLLNEDCAILIKGSRAMHMDEIVDKLKEM
ncbi:UDP-N-acetylmuramoyl-tripeptide--D-alanyl-D-alanine ligase [Faecalitalea cylindroides]|uniref:UDP-N-acetylmuramoyl-tripeptide--D-alanyl-D- alanine ligase n=1 Tax=Faecalitalea cylindroides TaxID=39483 RepID=UPI00195E5679|nr:UDP-N-acetylmuramoyl-tripeptide--D-alanyl-D-alanine ligase [Faecalitalea cylindroides]MBM6810712.1 UDP-N-acetylmuramoyl-tripeptide--D-alanyl-D-alanine ligase [Faecalitalea cylindroides]